MILKSHGVIIHESTEGKSKGSEIFAVGVYYHYNMSRDLPKVCVSCSPAVSADCFLSVLHLYSFPISWRRKNKMFPDLKFTAAAALSPNLPLGSPSSLAASAAFAPPRDLYKQAEHKGWRGHRGPWWMLSCSFENKLHSPHPRKKYRLKPSHVQDDVETFLPPSHQEIHDASLINTRISPGNWLKVIRVCVTHKHIFVFAALLDLCYQCPAHLSMIIFMTFSLVPPVDYHHNVRFMKSAAGDCDVSCLSLCELKHKILGPSWKDERSVKRSLISIVPLWLLISYITCRLAFGRQRNNRLLRHHQHIQAPYVRAAGGDATVLT